MFCTHCGHEVEEGAKFCTKCGHVVGVDAAAAPVVDLLEEQSFTTPVPVEDPAVAAIKKKRGITILILAILGVVFVEIAFGVLGYYSALYNQPNFAEQEEMFLSLLTCLPLTIGGFVMVCVAKGMANKLAKTYGKLRGVALAGNIICIPGLILSIMNFVFTVVMIGLLAAILGL